MIIGRHKVLLPINRNYNEICDILGFFKLKHKKFQEWKKWKKPIKCARAMARTVQLLRHDAHCPITLSY